jgi:hypothetical protein
VIPGTFAADLNDIHREFSEFFLHLCKFVRVLNPSGELPELVTECVSQFNQGILLADWTVTVNFLAMIFSCSHQIWVGITCIDYTTKEGQQRGTLIK